MLITILYCKKSSEYLYIYYLYSDSHNINLSYRVTIYTIYIKYEILQEKIILTFFVLLTPTKNLCILVLTPLCHFICTSFLQWYRKCTFLVLFWTYLHYIWCKFSIWSLNDDWTEPSKEDIETILVSNISTMKYKKKHHI